MGLREVKICNTEALKSPSIDFEQICADGVSAFRVLILNTDGTTTETFIGQDGGEITPTSWIPGACNEVQCKKASTLYTVIDNTGTRFNWTADIELTWSDGAVSVINQTPTGGWSAQLNQWVTLVQAVLDERCPAAVAEARCNITPAGCGGLLPPPDELLGIIPEMRWRYLQILACPTCPAIVRARTIQVNGVERFIDLPLKFVKGQEFRYDLCQSCGEAGVLYEQGTNNVVAPANYPICLFDCAENIPEAPSSTCTFVTRDLCDDGNDLGGGVLQPVVAVYTNCGDGEFLTSTYILDVDGGLSEYTPIGNLVDCDSGGQVEPPEPIIEASTMSEVIVCADGVRAVKVTLIDTAGNEIERFYGDDGIQITPTNWTIGDCCSENVCLESDGSGSGLNDGSVSPVSVQDGGDWNVSGIGTFGSLTDGSPAFNGTPVLMDNSGGGTRGNKYTNFDLSAACPTATVDSIVISGTITNNVDTDGDSSDWGIAITDATDTLVSGTVTGLPTWLGGTSASVLGGGGDTDSFTITIAPGSLPATIADLAGWSVQFLMQGGQQTTLEDIVITIAYSSGDCATMGVETRAKTVHLDQCTINELRDALGGGCPTSVSESERCRASDGTPVIQRVVVDCEGETIAIVYFDPTDLNTPLLLTPSDIIDCTGSGSLDIVKGCVRDVTLNEEFTRIQVFDITGISPVLVSETYQDTSGMNVTPAPTGPFIPCGQGNPFGNYECYIDTASGDRYVVQQAIFPDGNVAELIYNQTTNASVTALPGTVVPICCNSRPVEVTVTGDGQVITLAALASSVYNAIDTQQREITMTVKGLGNVRADLVLDNGDTFTQIIPCDGSHFVDLQQLSGCGDNVFESALDEITFTELDNQDVVVIVNTISKRY